MDGLDWRIAVTAFVISILMVSQCACNSRVAAKPQQYNVVQYREAQHKNTLVIESTTMFPVNPYVFSAEDYNDLLQQNAKSLQGARSLISYEPQRIDAAGQKSSEKSLEWNGTVSSSTQSQQKFNEVPTRKRSSRTGGNVESSSMINQRRRFDVTPSTTTTVKPHQLQTPMLDRRRNSDARKRQRSKNWNKDEIIDQEAAGLMFVLNDRIPRPFGFTTEPTLTTRNYSAVTPRQYNYRSHVSGITSIRPNPIASSMLVSTVKIPPQYYENIEQRTTQSPPIIYTIPRRIRKPRPTIVQPSYQNTDPSYQTIAPLQRRQDEASPSELPMQQTIVHTEVLPVVEEVDRNEPNDIRSIDDAVPSPPLKNDDRREYSYNHVERYEEPLESTKEDEYSNDTEQAGDNILPVAEVQDLITEGDHHHKAQHEPEHHHEEGEEGASEEHGSKEHHEEGDKGHKDHEDYHEHEDGEKGHHIKEKHDHHYDEEGGDANKHHDEAGYHEEQEHGEEGEKKKAFHEKGKHHKGHSTKGEHVVHKKDAFEKKIEFYDESHEGGDDEKDGAHHREHHRKKGHHYEKGHHHKGHEEDRYGHKGHSEKGHHHRTKKGHSKEEGDGHHRHDEKKYGKKGGHENAKHWHHKKGKRR